MCWLGFSSIGDKSSAGVNLSHSKKLMNPASAAKNLTLKLRPMSLPTMFNIFYIKVECLKTI